MTLLLAMLQPMHHRVRRERRARDQVRQQPSLSRHPDDGVSMWLSPVEAAVVVVTTATASTRLNRFIRCTTFNGPDADTRFDC